MASLLFAAALAASVVGVGADSTTNTTVWAAVAFVMHGERTPEKSSFATALTPQGANQLWNQGAAFRARYLSGSQQLNDTDNLITTRNPIAGIQRNALDNSQLSLASTTDSFVVEGAAAFMQGLYPPITQAFPDNVGGVNFSESAATGDVTNFPLGGYQYPVINTLSVLDENSLPLQGNIGCPEWLTSVMIDMRQEAEMVALYNQTLALYQNLFSEQPLAGTLPIGDANIWDAYNIYDLVQYMYNHNQTVYSELERANTTLNLLQTLAADQQVAMNSNQTASGANPNDKIRTVAGQTMAQKVLEQFAINDSYGGSQSKLTVLFGSMEPFLAFWSLAGLQASGNPGVFTSLPQPGSTMIFELIGPGSPNDVNGNDSSSPDYPGMQDLQVRFVYRADTNSGTPFLEQSLFGYHTTVMPYLTFMAEMQQIAMDVDAWCQTCNSIQLFCLARQAITDSGSAPSTSNSPARNPVVAGIIGAIVGIAIVTLGLLAAALLGGFRVHRRDPRETGGFKGAEKMPGDADVAVGKGGAHHERVGSWELRGGKNVASDTVMTTDAFDRRHADEDGISEMEIVPVKPRESF